MFLSIDIGGTTTRVAASDNLKDILLTESFPSQKKLGKQIELLNSTITKLVGGRSVFAAAVGVAGIIDKQQNKIILSPNYASLNDLSIHSLLNLSQAKILLFNDTELAALGEASLGAGKSYSKVAYLSLGTGVGGALVCDNKIAFENAHFEPGHQIINFKSTHKDKMGIPGSLETYLAGHRTARFKTDADWILYGEKLAVGINNLAMLWSPDCVVIGGGVTANYEKFIFATESYLSKFAYINKVKVLKSQFGQGSGIVGGFVMLSREAANS